MNNSMLWMVGIARTSLRATSATLVLMCALLSTAAHALTAVRTTHPIKLDGKLDETDWSRTPAMDQWIENLPNEKAPARYKSELRVLFDEHALYIGVIAHDDEPDRIVAPFVRRDKVVSNQDNFIVWIDPTGAGKFAQFFRVNARGVLADGIWNEDALEEDFSPDFDFDAEVARSDKGWSAEFRIPWGTLRVPFPTPAQLKIIAFRNMPRDSRIRMSTAPLGREPACWLCVAEPLTGFGQLNKPSSLTLAPTVTLDTARTRIGNNASVSDNGITAGIDVKWRPSTEWVLDATLRPDFSQLELDTPQLKGNTRFALSVQEKRPFFLEGSDLYSLPLNAVYTRSITDPLWGTRATYRSEALDAMALTVADRGGGFVILPGTYFSDFKPQGKSQATIARVRAPFAASFGGGSIGALLSDRNYDDGTRNTVIGADAMLKPNDESRLRAQVMSSRTEDGATTNGHAAFIDGFYDDGKNRFSAWAYQLSPQFRADNALQPQNGYRELGFEARRCMPHDGFFNNICPNLVGKTLTTWSGEALSRKIAPSLWANGPRNLTVGIEPRYFNYARVAEGGKWHHTPTLFTQIEANPSPWIPYLFAEFEMGRGVDVLADRLSRMRMLNLTLNTRPHERIELEWRINDLRLHDLDTKQSRYAETVLQLVGVGYITAHDTVRVIAQDVRAKRNQAAYAFDVLPRAHTQAVSVVYAHKWSLARELNIGATFSEDRLSNTPNARTIEAFVKFGWTLNL